MLWENMVIMKLMDATQSRTSVNAYYRLMSNEVYGDVLSGNCFVTKRQFVLALYGYPELSNKGLITYIVAFISTICGTLDLPSL